MANIMKKEIKSECEGCLNKRRLRYLLRDFLSQFITDIVSDSFMRIDNIRQWHSSKVNQQTSFA